MEANRVMKTLLLPVILLSLVLAVPANGQTPNEPALPYTPSLDVSSMDKSIDPCSNFYQYACGGWRKKNPIPPDQTSWSVYGKLYQDNLNFLRRILEQASSSTNQRDAVTQQIGDFYAACVDEAGIEKSGPDPIKLELEAIARLNSVRELAPLVARLQMATGGYRSIFFRGGSDQDPDDSEHMIASLDQGGLGLPDRDYYTKEDAKSKEAREQYVRHVQKIFELLGDNAETAKKNAETLVSMETALAKASMARVERRNPYNLKHKMEIPGLEELAPNFDWKAYYRVLQYPKIEILNVGDPAFFKQVNAALASEPLANWKTYLRLHVADSSAQYLSAKFVQENFDFYRKYLRGAKEQQPRWKRFRNKIGYPDKWRDYSAVKITQSEFLGNVQRATEFEHRREIAKIGKPVDHGEWMISPATVDAYYNPQMNDINFPAGVLQPPLYDSKVDDAPNYGDTGGTIGHELTHGFDDEGSQFDAKGNLKDWWKKEDREKFDERTKCVSDQYSQYVVVEDVHINGKLTMGEDVADLGGEILAYMAWDSATVSKNLQPVDGLTPEQRFFIGFAQWDCANERPEDLRVRAQTDPHSPPEYRFHGVLVNMPEFARAFSCRVGQPMVKPPENVCKVW